MGKSNLLSASKEMNVCDRGFQIFWIRRKRDLAMCSALQLSVRLNQILGLQLTTLPRTFAANGEGVSYDPAEDGNHRRDQKRKQESEVQYQLDLE